MHERHYSCRGKGCKNEANQASSTCAAVLLQRGCLSLSMSKARTPSRKSSTPSLWQRICCARTSLFPSAAATAASALPASASTSRPKSWASADIQMIWTPSTCPACVTAVPSAALIRGLRALDDLQFPHIALVADIVNRNCTMIAHQRIFRCNGPASQPGTALLRTNGITGFVDTGGEGLGQQFPLQGILCQQLYTECYL